MRDYKFRGKRRGDKEWVYGYFLMGRNGAAIYDVEIGEMPVDPATFGMFTGRKDKNGKEIYWWEGDVFERWGQLLVIVYSQGCFFFERRTGSSKVYGDRQIPCYEVNWWANDTDSGPKFKKIGNIHDNPELLKETTRNIEEGGGI